MDPSQTWFFYPTIFVDVAGLILTAFAMRGRKHGPMPQRFWRDRTRVIVTVVGMIGVTTMIVFYLNHYGPLYLLEQFKLFWQSGTPIGRGGDLLVIRMTIVASFSLFFVLGVQLFGLTWIQRTQTVRNMRHRFFRGAVGIYGQHYSEERWADDDRRTSCNDSVDATERLLNPRKA